MTPERWQQIRAVFEHAEQLADAECAQYLDQACNGDEELRQEVESLLAAAARAGGEFLGTPAANLLQQESEPNLAFTRIGRRIGPYQIIAEIGHGGMGEVFRAVRIDGQFDQQVAIKLVRVGMGSAFIVQRFLHERQILASLNHSNIARLLDGGTTTDEVPYLVMELIEGERIDAYCDSHKLSVSERLRLFLKVCDAVQYAHQRLVVHRDLKPSNIIVTKDGIPKLLDFGIAKMLDPTADQEATLARPMTPEYASPEQIRGGPITTATDVYSLGVVLFQLLTGQSPYGIEARTAHEWPRAITDTQPQRASAVAASSGRSSSNAAKPSGRSGSITSSREPTLEKLSRRLAGDVDSILLMALRKEPDLRYGSVQQFTDDIARHLNGLPVASRKGSWKYFTKKFILRHRTGLAATALVILALAGGIVATERQAQIAQIERAKAQKRFDDVRRFSDSLIFEIHDALQAIPGTTSARSLLLDRAVQYLDSSSKDAAGDSELQRELAQAYQRLATVQGDATVSNTGQISAAESSTRKAIALFESVANANPKNFNDQLNLARAYRRKGISDAYYPDGRQEIEKAIVITDRLLHTENTNRKLQSEVAVELQGRAMCLDISGNRTQAIESFERALALLADIAQHDPSYSHIAESRAKMLVELGQELTYTGALEEARMQVEAGIAIYQALVDKGAQPDIVRDLAESHRRLGRINLMANNLPAARQQFAQAHETMTRLSKADSGNIMFHTDLLSLEFQQARMLVLEGRFKAAETQLQAVIAGFRNLGSEEDAGPGQGILYTWLGEAQSGSKNYAQALQSFQKALTALEGDVQYDDARTGQAVVSVRVGDMHRWLGQYTDAEAAYKRAQSKLGIPSAQDGSNLPASYASAAVEQGFRDLWMTRATSASTADQQALNLEKACAAYKTNLKFHNLPAVALRFSPNEFPIPDPIPTAEFQRRCEIQMPVRK